ncbi:MAG: hypothetical protein FJW63_10540, partial [Actinobacteria bacterium]|nr:hypothetical protein [Actinomycetota bacterium]
MDEFDKYLDKLKELAAENNRLSNIRDNYNEILDKLCSMNLMDIPYEDYRSFCNLNKVFINRKDIHFPSSRLSLAQGSIKYILDMMEIVWNKFFFEQKIATNLLKEIDYKGKPLQEIFSEFKGFTAADVETEKKKVNTLFQDFILPCDIVIDGSNDPLSKIIGIAHEIIKIIMVYYLSRELTVTLLEAWERVQDAIFPFDEFYRDHLIHQIYVFLLGTSLLSKLQKRIIENWKIIENKERNEEEMKRRTFRSWVCASLFHDIGYIGKKIIDIGKSVNRQFFTNLPGVSFSNYSFKISSRNKTLLEYLNLMDKVHTQNEFVYERFKGNKEGAILIQTALNELNHGVLSSYIFWNRVMHDIKNIQPRYINTLIAHFWTRSEEVFRLASTEEASEERKRLSHLIITERTLKAKKQDERLNKIFKQEVDEDIDVSAFAIAVHDVETYVINYYTHPIAYLVLLCDELQNWGRIKVKDKKIIMIRNEYIDCNVFFEEEKSLLINKFEAVTNASDAFLADIVSDVITIRYANFDEEDLIEFKRKLSKLYRNRLKGGPALV